MACKAPREYLFREMSLHPRAAERSLRRFLDKIGLTIVDIDVSSIPLRI